MTEFLPVVTDAYGASVLSSLIGGDYGSDVGGGTQQVIPSRGSIVVRLKSAIAAGSAAQVDAEIMELRAGVWTGTGQIVKVRSGSGLAVTTTGRRIARRVANFGYIVVET